MDIAGASVVLVKHQVRVEASLAMTNNAKDLLEQQGQKLIEMLQQTNSPLSHPTLGNTMDIKL